MLTEAEIEPLAADLLHRIQSLELPHPASHISKFVTISIGTATIIPLNLIKFKNLYWLPIKHFTLQKAAVETNIN